MINRLTRSLNIDNKIGHMLDRTSLLLIAAWLVTMILFPIGYWVAGDSVIPPAITIAALIQSLAVFYPLNRAWGFRRAAVLLAAVAVLTWFAEFVGSKTGFPFGRYDYTPVLQPQLGGVPLLIPFAWFMMLPPAWAVVQAAWPHNHRTFWHRLQFAGLSAMCLTAWDLFLDPQMVGWNFWQWQEPSGYFGIPFSNYLGWLLVSFVISWLLYPRQLPLFPLIIVYAAVWFLQSIGLAVFWGQPGPALFGSIGMGIFLALALRSRFWASSSSRW
jgi:putative membrane protein